MRWSSYEEHWQIGEERIKFRAVTKSWADSVQRSDEALSRWDGVLTKGRCGFRGLYSGVLTKARCGFRGLYSGVLTKGRCGFRGLYRTLAMRSTFFCVLIDQEGGGLALGFSQVRIWPVRVGVGSWDGDCVGLALYFFRLVCPPAEHCIVTVDWIFG
jgi:hypothetical protein